MKEGGEPGRGGGREGIRSGSAPTAFASLSPLEWTCVVITNPYFHRVEKTHRIGIQSVMVGTPPPPPPLPSQNGHLHTS